jgi:hypothetical protein
VPRFISPGLIYTGAALESPKKGGSSFVLAIKKEPDRFFFRSAYNFLRWMSPVLVRM